MECLSARVMKYMIAKEYICGTYYYKMPIDDKLVNDINEYYSKHIENFPPLTIKDVEEIAADNEEYERWNETYTYTYYDDVSREIILGEQVYEYLCDDLWCYREEYDDCMETEDVERWVE